MFVALMSPQAVIDELSRAVEEVRATHRRLRWSRPEQAHLTLAFLGAVGQEPLPGLTAGLGAVAARTAPLELSFGDGGRFGGRVLWTRVCGDVEGLNELAEAVRAAALAAGLPVEERPYQPHLTLARSRDGRSDLRPAVAELAGFVGTPWRAGELHLVRSYLGAGPGGTAAQEPYERWSLGGKRHQAPGSGTSTG
jgi:2'-5' RNA ligase